MTEGHKTKSVFFGHRSDSTFLLFTAGQESKYKWENLQHKKKLRGGVQKEALISCNTDGT
jgi:hypothetical protein